jgi:molybdopterin converting factor subunit 1
MLSPVGVVKVFFFARLKEVAGLSEIQIPHGGPSSLEQFVSQLEKAVPQIVPFIKTARVAVNGVLVTSDTMIQGGDEVALLPPFSGG